MAHRVHADDGVERPIGERQRLADVGPAEVGPVVQAGLPGEGQPGLNARLADVHPRDPAAGFARQEQGRAAGAAADIQDVVGGGQFQEAEEPPVLGAGHPAALAEVFAVGFAADLLQDLRGEVTVGRAIQVHRRGHGFLRTVGGDGLTATSRTRDQPDRRGHRCLLIDWKPSMVRTRLPPIRLAVRGTLVRT